MDHNFIMLVLSMYLIIGIALFAVAQHPITKRMYEPIFEDNRHYQLTWFLLSLAWPWFLWKTRNREGRATNAAATRCPMCEARFEAGGWDAHVKGAHSMWSNLKNISRWRDPYA